MPIEKDLKVAYDLLYNENQAEKALKLYENVLKQCETNLMGLIYKAAALEKLYHGNKKWHEKNIIEESNQLLDKALNVAISRGSREKIALVYFRFFVHEFNKTEYEKADSYMKKAKEFGYKDDTMTMWEASLAQKLSDRKAMGGREVNKVCDSVGVCKEVKSNEAKFRKDWYQSSKQVSISFFMDKSPVSSDDVEIELKADQILTVRCTLGKTKFDLCCINLAHQVEPQNFKVEIFTKKFELTLNKKDTVNWKTLEYNGSAGAEQAQVGASQKTISKTESSALRYPSSSKKNIDWNKLHINDDENEEQQSVDQFFQSLYKNADADAKRAMMKSFIESNGTALNTDWSEVSKGKVETALPSGVDMKEL